MNSLLLVMAGGAVGSGARYLVGRVTLAVLGPAWPWGTLSVNLLGSLLMGLLAGLLARTAAGEPWRLLLGVGLLGGFTTFSAFTLDAMLMIERGAFVSMLGYVAASILGALAALALGLQLARVTA